MIYKESCVIQDDDILFYELTAEVIRNNNEYTWDVVFFTKFRHSQFDDTKIKFRGVAYNRKYAVETCREAFHKALRRGY